MGFGLLLIGYFTATLMALHSLGGIFRTVGYAVVIFASRKLAQYNRSFFVLLGMSAIMVLFSALCAVNDLSTFLYNNLLIPAPIISTDMATTLTSIRVLFDLVFTAVLCFCVKSIAKETGAQKIVYTSVRNFVFFCIFCVLQFVIWLATWVDSPSLAEFVLGTMLPVWMVILNIVCMVLICVMLFSCYAKICDAEDTEMKQRPSRFEFINRMRAEKEEKHEKLIAEAQAYTEEQKERSAATQRAKKKNKRK